MMVIYKKRWLLLMCYVVWESFSDTYMPIFSEFAIQILFDFSSGNLCFFRRDVRWNVFKRESKLKKVNIVHTSKSIFFFLSSDERWRSIIPLASIDISIFISEDCDEKKKRMSFASHIWERKKKNIPLPMVFSWTL